MPAKPWQKTAISEALRSPAEAPGLGGSACGRAQGPRARLFGAKPSPRGL
nr:MAG TPA: hypothetical protein [Caudoviricetes sp.]